VEKTWRKEKRYNKTRADPVVSASRREDIG
jgi:hypothetical protein